VLAFRRSAAVVLAATLAAIALIAPTTAHAEYFFTKSGAQRVARDWVSKHYAGYDVTFGSTVAVCRPQFERYNPRFKYHRWVCGWSDGTCSGAASVIGSSSARGAYYGRTLAGIRCD
jgi:hypothetical protein